MIIVQHVSLNTFLRVRTRWMEIISKTTKHILVRLSLIKLLKSAAIDMNADTGFRFVIMSIRFAQYERQAIKLHIRAFILIRLPREQPFRRPEFACTFVSYNL